MTTPDVSDPAARGPTRRVVLSLGSNLGDSPDTMQGAVDALFDAPGLDFVTMSRIYQTAPVGGPEQPDYLNAILLADTALPPDALLERVRSVEAVFHRDREVRWGPRTIDIDIVAVGDLTSEDPELTLPHPRAYERAFVLVPWQEVDAEAELVGHGRVADLLDRMDRAGVRLRDDLTLQPPA